VGSVQPVAMQLRSLARRTLDKAQGEFASFRACLTLNEVSGTFGDIGTFLPLLVSKPSHTNLRECSGVAALAEQHQGENAAMDFCMPRAWFSSNAIL
jgi:hypothetical protein